MSADTHGDASVGRLAFLVSCASCNAASLAVVKSGAAPLPPCVSLFPSVMGSPAFGSDNGMTVLNTSPSVSVGFAPVYACEYLKSVGTPDPSSSARPIWLKNFAIVGFFGVGKEFCGLRAP